MVIANSVRAWLYLVPLIPSILVSVFNLYHLLTSRALRTALNNHVIILLLSVGLIFELTEVAWDIHLYRTGTVLSSTPAFCLIWAFIGPATNISIYILMAWASIERHILVFYPNWYATKTKRFLLHYFPLAVCLLWPTVFYFVMFFILPCSAAFNYNYSLCSRYTCVLRFRWASLLDSIAHYTMPAFTTVIFSVTLFARVLYHRYRIRGRIEWRNYKKMAGQLLPISALYIVLQLPPMILYTAYAGGLSPGITIYYYVDALFFTYWVVFFTPFATILSLPDLKTKCRKLFLFWRRQNAVRPVPIEMARRNMNQTIAVVPVVQSVMIETARRNINPTVAMVPVVQTATNEMARQDVNQTVAELPVVQPATNEMARQNVNETVTVLPILQPVLKEMACQNVNQTVSELPVVQ